jgi:3-hydroxybutyryl-CoA dehydrogenase
MTILIIGPLARLEECKLKFGAHHSYRQVSRYEATEDFDVAFDFMIEDNPNRANLYPIDRPVFFNTACITLKEISRFSRSRLIFGFNGLPTFTHREWLEVCLRQPEDRAALEKICTELNTKFEVVEDRVGLVTARIIGMIINEAYLTAEEGTASREDIDKAMKLGTNYPYGPFEWAQRIGLKEIRHLLDSVHRATRDERYKPCRTLTQEAN